MNAKLIKLENGEYDLLVDTNLKSLKGTKLSLKNCQAIERGYDLDELASEYSEGKSTAEVFKIAHESDFKAGFQKALELMGDKKFSEDDVISMIEKSRETGLTAEYLILTKQQTEWDVIVEMECCGNYSPPCNINCEYGPKPKLDAEGCLILKLKSE